MAMKRSIETAELETLDMAKCLIYLSHSFRSVTSNSNPSSAAGGDAFECKTCNRRFSSFQALGGHRASHKRPKIALLGLEKLGQDGPKVQTKPKMHECSICGVEFALGQALGGHMRRHRAAATMAVAAPKLPAAGNSNKLLPVLRRSGSCKSVFGLDLNLSPLENDLQYLFGKMAPNVSIV
ncbi:unnamed protein product [Linum tenue]|uniref:C2H2-type domain-containing protein n=1 Tax=Linum tenue TaxID=586396 RepID=A0AAV0P7F6_9ROSI|nr:unnamed protein product [Linum tenue]